MYEIDIPVSTQTMQADPFRKILHKAVDDYFQATGLSRNGGLQMQLKTAVIFSWYLLSYILLVFVVTNWWQAVLASLSLGCAIAGIGFNIQHDGSHKAYSKFKWLNKMTALSMDFIGASSYLWMTKHNFAHHTYTNITGKDSDIDMGILARLSPHKRRLWYHKYQHMYAWLLYGLLVHKWQLLDDYYNVFRGKVGAFKITRPHGKELIIFISGKVVSLTIAIVIPLFFHTFAHVLLFYFITLWFTGVILAIVFQLAHVVEEAAFPQPQQATEAIKDDWDRHQVETTVDFARGNTLLTWYLGGLNYQVEHHLFPRICHLHYPRLSPVIEKVCRDTGVKYNAHIGFFKALQSHYRWLRRMGQPSPK